MLGAIAGDIIGSAYEYVEFEGLRMNKYYYYDIRGI